MDGSKLSDELLTPEQVQSWADLRVEICFTIKKESFWLVREYTGKDRAEISIQDLSAQAAAIKNILLVFPEAKVESVLRDGMEDAKNRR